MGYAAQYNRALDKVADKGASVTFTKTTPGATETVTGSAVALPGSAKLYDALGLIEKNPVTLLFVPSPRSGGDPPLGAKATWGGRSRVVRHTDPLAPDGEIILSTVVME